MTLDEVEEMAKDVARALTAQWGDGEARRYLEIDLPERSGRRCVRCHQRLCPGIGRGFFQPGNFPSPTAIVRLMIAAGCLSQRTLGTMASVSNSAIYMPPKVGFPYLVVILKDDGEIMSFMRAKSQGEAKTILEKGGIDPDAVLASQDNPLLHI